MMLDWIKASMRRQMDGWMDGWKALCIADEWGYLGTPLLSHTYARMLIGGVVGKTHDRGST